MKRWQSNPGHGDRNREDAGQRKKHPRKKIESVEHRRATHTRKSSATGTKRKNHKSA